MRRTDNIYDLVERAAARHRIPPLQLWQETAKAIIERKLPIVNSLSDRITPVGGPTLEEWLFGFRASVDRFNALGPRARILKQIIVYSTDFERWFRKTHKQRGPEHGTTGYQALDSKLFPQISRLLKMARSSYGAALMLADQGKIAGAGSRESKAKRVSRLYLRETRSR